MAVDEDGIIKEVNCENSYTFQAPFPNLQECLNPELATLLTEVKAAD